MFHGTKAGSELRDIESVCTCWGMRNSGPTSWNVCACVRRVGNYEHANGTCISARVCMFMEGGGS